MNIEQIRTFVTQKCGQSPHLLDDMVVRELVDSNAHPDVREYVRHCLPPETCCASQVRVLPWKAIVREMGESSAPGSFIRKFGYFIIATSVGGNVVCLHSPSGRVFWADHESFSKDMIMFQNRATGEWHYLQEYSPENVQRAMVLLSQNLETFLTSLLTDQLAPQLGALD